MKIVSYVALHYGKEWLEWSLRSVADFMDECHVFYTPHPSHGHTTNSTCPETEEELREIVSWTKNAVWHHVDQFNYEGEHRDYCRDYCLNEAGADLVLWVDADEVWDADVLADALQQAWTRPENAFVWRTRVAGHYWRSVNWVCHDEACPTRIIKKGGDPNVDAYIQGPGFHHFGYAQSIRLIAYKLKIHGHRNEIRRNWLGEKYIHWKPGMGDVHPTNVDFWTPVPFDRHEIGHLISDHPYFNDDLI